MKAASGSIWLRDKGGTLEIGKRFDRAWLAAMHSNRMFLRKRSTGDARFTRTVYVYYMDLFSSGRHAAVRRLRWTLTRTVSNLGVSLESDIRATVASISSLSHGKGPMIVTEPGTFGRMIRERIDGVRILRITDRKHSVFLLVGYRFKSLVASGLIIGLEKTLLCVGRLYHRRLPSGPA